MENSASGPTDKTTSSIEAGDRVWCDNDTVIVVHIIPAHDRPTDHDARIDAGVIKYMKPPSEKFPPQQARESIECWKKWHEDMYIVCNSPNSRWVCRTRRVRLTDLSTTPPAVVENTIKPPKKRFRR